MKKNKIAVLIILFYLCVAVLASYVGWILVKDKWSDERWNEPPAQEELEFQLTTDNLEEVASIKTGSNIAMRLVVDDWEALADWCKDKSDCHEIAIVADNEVYYFTFKELIAYANARQTKETK